MPAAADGLQRAFYNARSRIDGPFGAGPRSDCKSDAHFFTHTRGMTRGTVASGGDLRPSAGSVGHPAALIAIRSRTMQLVE
jgi:hypothetical protein